MSRLLFDLLIEIPSENFSEAGEKMQEIISLTLELREKLVAIFPTFVDVAGTVQVTRSPQSETTASNVPEPQSPSGSTIH